VFQIAATGRPEQVWSMLTTPEETRRFLFGISLESTWVLGAPVTGWLGGAPVMWGEVLFAKRPQRLSYVLASGPGHPEVYATWEMAACDDGAMVTLSVCEADTDDGSQVEAAWRPVVTRLETLLSGR